MGDLPLTILGAGAAGLMAAIFAAGRGRRVLLLERTRDGGRKILVSGGGRCNILPSVAEPARFVTDSSPNTLRKILTSWPLPEQRRFFEEEAGIPLALEPETGKLFPVSNSAREVRDKLLALARRRGTEVRFEALVTDLVPPDGQPPGECVSMMATRDRCRGSHHRDRRVIPARHGKRRRRIGDRPPARPYDLSTYPALTPLTLDPPRYAAARRHLADV